MSFVDYENKGAYSIITINNPSQLNALNSQVLDDLNAALDQIDLRIAYEISDEQISWLGIYLKRRGILLQ